MIDLISKWCQQNKYKGWDRTVVVTTMMFGMCCLFCCCIQFEGPFMTCLKNHEQSPEKTLAQQMHILHFFKNIFVCLFVCCTSAM